MPRGGGCKKVKTFNQQCWSAIFTSDYIPLVFSSSWLFLLECLLPPMNICPLYEANIGKNIPFFRYLWSLPALIIIVFNNLLKYTMMLITSVFRRRKKKLVLFKNLEAFFTACTHSFHTNYFLPAKCHQRCSSLEVPNAERYHWSSVKAVYKWRQIVTLTLKKNPCSPWMLAW